MSKKWCFYCKCVLVSSEKVGEKILFTSKACVKTLSNSKAGVWQYVVKHSSRYFSCFGENSMETGFPEGRGFESQSGQTFFAIFSFILPLR